MGLFILTVFFQNCGQNAFRARPTSSSEQSSNEDVENPMPATNPLGKTYYVATNGSDNNTGTSTKPFKTIQRVVEEVKSGDLVIIRKGKHAPFELTNINGAAGAPITFRGEPGAIIDRHLGGNAFRNIYFVGGSYVTIDGLELVDSDPAPALQGCGAPPGRNGIKMDKNKDGLRPHHLVFKNMNIHGIRGTGILGSSDYLEFIDNHVHDNGINANGVMLGAYGTYLKGRYLIIRGNDVHDNKGEGIRVGNTGDVVGTSELLVDSTIENNKVYNNGGYFRGGTEECVYAGTGIVVWHGSGNIIRNNVVFDNVAYGIRVNEDTMVNNESNLVYNNTVYKNGSYGIHSQLKEHQTIITNNISYLNAKDDIFQGVQSSNLTTDPKFENAEGGDFRLHSNSPAIDAGVTLKEVTKDFRGVSRQVNAYDIGAFEY